MQHQESHPHEEAPGRGGPHAHAGTHERAAAHEHGDSHEAADPRDAARRRVLTRLGWAGLSLLTLASLPGLIRFLRPRAGRDRGGLVELGPLAEYQTAGVSARWVQRHGLWLVRRAGRLFALEARCTHLGCTPRWMGERGGFLCPCHGSRFTEDGVPLNGPATVPLMRLAIRVERGEVVVDPATRAPIERAERDPRFYVRI